MASRKTQVRFSSKEDIFLLKEVVAHDPFNNRSKWTVIASNITEGTDLKIDGRRARERTLLLLTQYKRDDRQALRRSGSEEDFTEKKQLLSETESMSREAEENQEKKKKSAEESGKAIRKRALEGLKEKSKDQTDDDDHRVTPKLSKTNISNYLIEKTKAEKEAKEMEIKLKQEQLKFEREKFELEKEERLTKLQNEKRQSELMLKLFEQLIKK